MLSVPFRVENTYLTTASRQPQSEACYCQSKISSHLPRSIDSLGAFTCELATITMLPPSVRS